MKQSANCSHRGKQESSWQRTLASASPARIGELSLYVISSPHGSGNGKSSVTDSLWACVMTVRNPLQVKLWKSTNPSRQVLMGRVLQMGDVSLKSAIIGGLRHEVLLENGPSS